jgi:hypothetical protein
MLGLGPIFLVGRPLDNLMICFVGAFPFWKTSSKGIDLLNISLFATCWSETSQSFGFHMLVNTAGLGTHELTGHFDLTNFQPQARLEVVYT